MPAAASRTGNEPPTSPDLLGGGRYHRECCGVAPFCVKRLDVAVVQQHLPAARSLGENLGKADACPFGWSPLLLKLLNVHTPSEANISRDGRLEVFQLQTVVVHPA